jgi:hypothetical protein
LPIEAFQPDILGEMLAKFYEQGEWCLRIESFVSRVCNLILGLANDRVWLTVCLVEGVEQHWRSIKR